MVQKRLKSRSSPRPETKTAKLVRSVFSDHDCKSCGRCCRTACGAFAFDVLPPDTERLPDLEHARGAFVQKGRFEGLTLLFMDGKCGFLEHGKQGCSIYADRPSVCRVYPFIVSSERKVALAQTCPPIRHIRSMGVSVVKSSDFFVSSAAAKNGHNSSFLASCFRSMRILLQDLDKYATPASFHYFEGEPVFPIE